MQNIFCPYLNTKMPNTCSNELISSSDGKINVKFTSPELGVSVYSIKNCITMKIVERSCLKVNPLKGTAKVFINIVTYNLKPFP